MDETAKNSAPVEIVTQTLDEALKDAGFHPTGENRTVVGEAHPEIQ